MLKQALVILLAAGLMMSVGGCTSKKTEEAPADVAEVAGEGGDAALGEDVAAAEGGDDLGGDELSPDEQLPEDTASGTAEGGDDFATPAEELAESPEATDAESGLEQVEEGATGDAMAEATPTPEPMSEEAPPSTIDESLSAGADDAGVSEPEPISEPIAEEAPKVLPLRKIADTPWEQNGVAVNAVYLARPGDNLDGILTKIYGSTERKKEVVKINPMLKNRDVKVGDKIYYNSPQRPTDTAKLLTYYEDMGLAPETYVVSKTENIRDIAKNLFGDSNSWKELWSTNMDVESKGELSEGTQLRYWAGAGTTMAAQPPPMETPVAEMPVPTEQPPVAPMDQAPPPPPPMDQTMDQQSPDQMAMNTPPPIEQAPPPPPPPSDLPPPPPPPAVGETQAAGGEPGQPSADGGMGAAMDDPLAFLNNPDQAMILGVGVILIIAALALFISIKKRRSRRNIDFHTSTQTQID